MCVNNLCFKRKNVITRLSTKSNSRVTAAALQAYFTCVWCTTIVMCGFSTRWLPITCTLTFKVGFSFSTIAESCHSVSCAVLATRSSSIYIAYLNTEVGRTTWRVNVNYLYGHVTGNGSAFHALMDSPTWAGPRGTVDVPLRLSTSK